jgi:hypothetical protein
MARDDTNKFSEWAATIGIAPDTAANLLRFLPDDGVLDPKLPCWISSPSYVVAANNPAAGLGIEKELIQHGFIIVGSCPNGDPVAVGFREPDLPVFYLSHEQLPNRPVSEVMRKISDSIAAYDEAFSNENSDIPLDYWGTKRQRH